MTFGTYADDLLKQGIKEGDILAWRVTKIEKPSTGTTHQPTQIGPLYISQNQIEVHLDLVKINVKTQKQKSST